MLAIALACAASSLPRYERENDDERLSLTSEPNPGSRRANVAAASGGSSSVTMTRTRLPAFVEPGDVRRRTHLQQRLLDDVARRAVERPGGRPGDGDRCEERGEKR